MKIRNKMLLGFLFITSVFLIVWYWGASVTRQAVYTYGKVRGETLPIIASLQSITFAGVRILASASEYGLIKAEVEAVKRLGKNDDSIEVADILAEEEEIIDASLHALDAPLQDYKELVDEFFPEEREYRLCS
jgi:hypothetical protein